MNSFTYKGISIDYFDQSHISTSKSLDMVLNVDSNNNIDYTKALPDLLAKASEYYGESNWNFMGFDETLKELLRFYYDVNNGGINQFFEGTFFDLSDLKDIVSYFNNSDFAEFVNSDQISGLPNGVTVQTSFKELKDALSLVVYLFELCEIDNEGRIAVELDEDCYECDGEGVLYKEDEDGNELEVECEACDGRGHKTEIQWESFNWQEVDFDSEWTPPSTLLTDQEYLEAYDVEADLDNGFKYFPELIELYSQYVYKSLEIDMGIIGRDDGFER